MVVEISSDLSPKFQEYVYSGPLPEASQASSRLVACIRPCEDPFKELIIKEETSSWSLLYSTQMVWEKMLSVTGARISKGPISGRDKMPISPVLFPMLREAKGCDGVGVTRKKVRADEKDACTCRNGASQDFVFSLQMCMSY